MRIRNRSSSAGEIRGLISKERSRNPPEEKGRIEKKIGMGDEKEEKMNKEKELKYSVLTDRQLLLYLAEKIKKIEEKEHEKARVKQEIKQEIQIYIEHDRTREKRDVKK